MDEERRVIRVFDDTGELGDLRAVGPPPSPEC